MTKVVSIINLKGGVAKTTTTVQLAECLSLEFDKKVLVIDLDPQTNATVALIGEDKWEQLDKDGQTIHQLFKDKIDGTSVFDVNRAIQSSVSNLKIPKLSLLPSSIQLIDIQDRLGEISAKTDHVISPLEVIKNKIYPEINKYDYVLIDCPPNLGYITKNGIEISDYYLIPTIPDSLSTYGIPQIIRNIEQLSKSRSLKIRCLGLIYTKYQPNASTHRRYINLFSTTFKNTLKANNISDAPIFKTIMPQSNFTADSTDFERRHSTLKEKYGYSQANGKKLHQYVSELTWEFIKYAG